MSIMVLPPASLEPAAKVAKKLGLRTFDIYQMIDDDQLVGYRREGLVVVDPTEVERIATSR
ncbi:hypothetical protein BH23ACT2_BH23ACT2_24240 [soil metagenome]